MTLPALCQASESAWVEAARSGSRSGDVAELPGLQYSDYGVIQGVGIMENKMETTIMVYIGIILGLYIGVIVGIIEIEWKLL